MATIIGKTIRGHRYYYLVQTAWVNGRSRYVKQRYLGKAEDLGKLLEQSTAPVPTHALHFEFGGTAALYSLAQQLRLVEIIDKHLPKRNQGLSVGQYALLAILNRCLAPTSKLQLARWYAATVLYRLLPADPAQLRSQRFFDHMGELSLSAIQAIEKEIAQVLVQNWGVDPTSLVYDATNFFSYIDTRTPSKIAKRGKNKARRIDLRQVSLGLLVSRDFHVPLFHEIYPGNRPDAVEFREVLKKLRTRYTEVFPEPHNITLVFDKGNNSRDGFRLLENSPYHFIGSLVPTQHEDLLDIPRRSFVALKSKRLAGVWVFRCTREVYGAERTVVVTWNRTFYKAQVRGLLATLNCCLRRLRHLTRLEHRRQQAHPKGKTPTLASIRRQVQAICHARHMKQLVSTQVKNTLSGVRLTLEVNEEEKNRLMTRLLGKTILFTDQATWSSEDIVLGYRGQYKLEDGFRTMKDSEACCWWPMNHWTDQKIRVHGFFCVIALLLLSLLQRQLAQKGIDISIARLIRCLTEIEETALAYAPRPAARGKTKARSVYVLTRMNSEQRALFDTLDLARYQHPTS